MVYRMPLALVLFVLFLASLLAGVFQLLPPKGKKAKKRKTLKSVEYIFEVVLGAGGLVLMALAYIVQSPTAQRVLAYGVWLLMGGGLLYFVWEIVTGIYKRSTGKQQDKVAVDIEGLKIIPGVTTPEVFIGRAFRPAWDTLVQEPEIPFVTCELHTFPENQYVGDLIFDAAKQPLTVEELKTTPIAEIHLDRGVL